MDFLHFLPSELCGLLLCAGLWLALRAYLRRWHTMRVVTVIDGDTVIAVSAKGRKRRIRLAGIDAPEQGQRMAEQAKQFVMARCLRQLVRVKLVGTDRYGRHVGYVRTNGRCLSRLLVSEGLAFALPAAWGLRGASTLAWLRGRGVHRGFGQPKPWAAGTRRFRFVGWMRWKFRSARRRTF